jgi:hypothetical protein
MLSDWLGDLLGGLIGDALIERRAEKAIHRQLAAFGEGRTVTIPCALRASDRWRPGRLALTRGRAEWTRRFGRAPELIVARGEATPLRSRSVRGSEALRLNPRLTVLAYRHGETILEFALRARDFPVLARVFELPGRPT